MRVTGDRADHDPQVQQGARAGRDAYIAGRDQTFNLYYLEAGGGPPQKAGAGRRAWGDVPARNPGFTGRGQLLAAVRQALLAGDRAVVQALHGMGGVGKTQLAIEYAHRYAAEYNVVWWIAAEPADRIESQFNALAAELGRAQPEAETAVMRRAVLSGLRESGPWLLVFDNAEDPEHIADWLPGGGAGHVLITSRASGWNEIAVPVAVDVLTRAESVQILRKRVPGLRDEDADLVAEALGDLPLAVVQAAAYLADTGMPAAEYVALLDTRAAEILDHGRPSSYPRSLAAVTQLAFEQLRAQEPAAAQLAVICAVLAPEPVPADFFTRAAAELPSPLSERAADPVALRQVVAALGRRALVRVDRTGLLMHRLTQATLRSHLSSAQAAVARASAEAVLLASNPGDTDSPANWPAWALLRPHALAAERSDTSRAGLRELARQVCWYLMKSGSTQAGYDLACELRARWSQQLGSQASATLQATTALAEALRLMSRYTEARPLDEQILSQRRRTLGPSHPGTLDAANNLAIDLRRLGDTQAARELDQGTLARRRLVLGRDHHQTLISASNLAFDLMLLGEPEAARKLNADTLARRERILGRDHPDTLASANNLAAGLLTLGQPESARELAEEALTRRRQVLGEDHPDALSSALGLALILRDLGDPRAAVELAEDTVARRRRVLGEDHPQVCEAEDFLADCLYDLGDFPAARESGEQTAARRRRVFGEDHPRTLEAVTQLAIVIRKAGDPQAARALNEDTLNRCQRVLGEDDDMALEVLNSLANDLYTVGDMQAARDLNEKSLARNRHLHGDEDPRTLMAAHNLANCLHALGEFPAAKDLREETLSRRRRVLGPDDSHTLGTAVCLADDLRELGERRLARDLDEDTLIRHRRVLGADHGETLSLAARLAMDMYELGEFRQALELGEDLLARVRRTQGEDDLGSLTGAAFVAATRYELGDLEAARELFAETLDRMRRVLGQDDPAPGKQPRTWPRRSKPLRTLRSRPARKGLTLTAR